MIEAFNERLVKYSHRLTSLRLLRNQLAPSYQDIFESVMEADKDAKGALTQFQVIDAWIQYPSAQISDLKAFMEYLFPFPQISYSTLTSFLVGIPPEQQSIKARQSNQILTSKIREIMSLQYENFIQSRGINQSLEKFIPTMYMKPTRKQFQSYVINQQLAVDIQVLSRALQLPELPIPFQHAKFSEHFPETLNDLDLQRLSSTMNRLKGRVRNLGAEWLG